MIVNKNVLTRTLEKLEFRKDKDIQDWVQAFKQLDDNKQFELIQYMEKQQGIFIKHCMANMVRPIDIYKLGTFYYKDGRKLYYDLKKEHPDKPVHEIVDMVKKQVRDKYKNKKR